MGTGVFAHAGDMAFSAQFQSAPGWQDKRAGAAVVREAADVWLLPVFHEMEAFETFLFRLRPGMARFLAAYFTLLAFSPLFLAALAIFS
jgi:hypothetical protein